MEDGIVQVRFASEDDLAFVGQDRYLAPDVLQRKIAMREVFIAEQDGEAIGYLRLEFLWSKVPYVGLVHVLDGCRRRGVGRALLKFLEQDLQARGHRTLYSSSQANEIEPQTWHRHVGFEECGVIAGINDGGIDEVFFRKKLQ
jgi:N-acetylglutamate synthase-like GNAT family acetyltransferase